MRFLSDSMYLVGTTPFSTTHNFTADIYLRQEAITTLTQLFLTVRPEILVSVKPGWHPWDFHADTEKKKWLE